MQSVIARCLIADAAASADMLGIGIAGEFPGGVGYSAPLAAFPRKVTRMGRVDAPSPPEVGLRFALNRCILDWRRAREHSAGRSGREAPVWQNDASGRASG